MFVRKQSHQIASNERSKIKISWVSIPADPPSLPHALHTNMYLPPNYPYNLILPPPLGKKLKETLASKNLGLANTNSTYHNDMNKL